MPKVMLPLAAQPLWLPTENIAAGPWEPVCAPVRLGAAAASVSFASIPAAFVMFRLYVEIINDTTTKNIKLRFNNDSGGSSYGYENLGASSTTLASGRTSADNSIQLAGTLFIGLSASQLAVIDVTIAKPIAGAAAMAVVSSSYNATRIFDVYAGIWNNTSALINRIDVVANSGNFAADSLFILQGSRS